MKSNTEIAVTLTVVGSLQQPDGFSVDVSSSLLRTAACSQSYLSTDSLLSYKKIHAGMQVKELRGMRGLRGLRGMRDSLMRGMRDSLN